MKFLLIVLSFAIVAFAQPDWSVWACLLASSVGYALFWKGMGYFLSKKGRFFTAGLWFFAVQAVQLSWFMADHYVGGYIWIFLLFLFLFLGVQFGLVSLLIGDPKDLRVVKILGISGIWVLLEWGRLFILSGFPWNSVGLPLSATLWGRQLVSLFGVFGLSFWVFFINLLALAYFSPKASSGSGKRVFEWCSWRATTVWIALMISPYLFGYLQVAFHDRQMRADSTPTLNALLVQTSIYPEQKTSLNTEIGIAPLIQWEHILSLLLPYVDKPIDLIVLPEAVVPYATDYPIYPIKSVQHAFQSFFGNSDHLPSAHGSKVSNSYWSQAVANTFAADVVIGLEDIIRESETASATVYNAAFVFRSFSDERKRYEKRVLVPMGEYIPFNFKWCKSLLSKYGIESSFTRGKRAKVFKTKAANIGLSICYEETYGHLMRENKLQGAELLVNLNNDVWYPHSRLPIVHFLHGRLRAPEGGVPLVRASNTGVTCGVDSLGRLIGMLDYETANTDSVPDALYLSIPLYRYFTFYGYFGDWPIIFLSVVSVCWMSAGRFH